MEETSEVQYEDNKALALPDKNKNRRRFKTPAQLNALEEFFNEHKYPTESMKAELAEKLGLTDKQVSGWFCHRRLKDKKTANEGYTPNRQDLSSGVIQDRGSGLKQDSCSSTKQGGDFRVSDIREVESRRFNRDDFPIAEPIYEPRRRLYDGGVDMDDNTSSESNADLRESFYPQNNRNPLDVGLIEYRTPPNGFVEKGRGRAGPSGYLKIKGQTENAAITAVKRQLGSNYLEDGPPLGIEFDPLPPGAFESPTKNTNYDAYRPRPPIADFLADTYKRPARGIVRDQDTYVEAIEYKPMHKPVQDSFSHHQPKQKQSFPNRIRSFPGQKTRPGIDSYSGREISDYDNGVNHNIFHKHEMRSDSYGGKITGELEEPWLPGYDNGNFKVARKREQLEERVPTVRLKDPNNVEDRVTSTRILKDNLMERRPIGEHHDSVRLKMRPSKELRAGTGKRGRDEFLQKDYTIRPSQELPPWTRQIKESTVEVPSSFSEDETAETSSSVD